MANPAAEAAMPQLNTAYYGNLIFWTLLGLIAIYFILSRIALPRIGSVLAERAGTVGNDLSAAEELNQKARAAEAAYQKALADARAESGRIAEQTRTAIDADLKAELAKADAQIAVKVAESEKALGDIRDQAVTSITRVAKDTVGEIVGLFGVSAEGETLSAAVDAKMKG
ncbi:ATP synthase F0, B subunit [Ketogulonicigenium robustum]|uniref:ATP synthase subunit b n=1 Tax=Ketogulonicigenium robustum TaxID=92947 RepID=A0A1W6NWI7_9RHOB|nr:F0F1 ATP synthase subunit B' [Ketogulonicigenium robustum]ARO13470.1 ATP synthase F0, B subunit [Ketogulonicigenium robustum]